MVIDSSAITAVLLNEANAADIAGAIESGSPRLLSPANLLEASIVIESRKGEAAGRELDFADLSRCDRGRCGRSRSSRDRAHCMAALWQGPPSGRAQLRRLLFLRSCKEPRAALLFQGEDFSRTDIDAIPLLPAQGA